jgi:hypothetical protein
MRGSFYLAMVSAALVSCGGKVVFDTGSSAGGASSSTNPFTVGHGTGTTAHTTTGVTSAVQSGVGVGVSSVTGVTTGFSAIAVTTGTGGNCFDPGAPPGSTMGTQDCGFMPCSQASNCLEVCSAIYDCGLAKCGPSGAQLCPAFQDSSTQHDGFFGGFGGQIGCLKNCAALPLIKQIVDPTNCNATIQLLKSVSPQFNAYCLSGGPPGG